MPERTIWKYRLKVEDLQEVEMPEGAEILCAQMQRDDLCIWALVDPAAQWSKRQIAIHGTGHPVSGQVRFIDTFQLEGGSLVFHVFERIGE